MSWQRGSEEDRIEAEREAWQPGYGKPKKNRGYAGANQESGGVVGWIVGIVLLGLGIAAAVWLFNHFNAGQ